MATVTCTSRLEHVGPCQPVDYQGGTVMEVLDALASDYPRLKHYVLDDQGKVRTHVAIFVGGTLQPRDTVLNRPISADEEVFIMQALSGG